MAQITSAGSGDSNDTGTWTGGVVPGNGDRAVIQAGHTVTVPGGVTWTVGHHPASDDVDPAINIAATGQLINNGTINCRGDLQLSNSDSVRSYVQGAGATFNFDFTATTSPSSQVYKVIQPSQYPGTQPSIQINGSSGSRCTFTAIAGGKGKFVGSGVNYFGLLEAYYCDFSNMGTAVIPFITPTLTSDTQDPSSQFIMENCTVTSCGAIDFNGYNMGQRALFRLLNTIFTSSVADHDLTINGYSTLQGSNTERTIRGCSFNKFVHLYAPTNFVITDNYFHEAYDTIAGVSNTGCVEFKRNTIRIPAGMNDIPVNAQAFDDNLIVYDDAAASNPHLISVGVYHSFYVRRNIFKFVGSASDGDCITIGSPSISESIHMQYNIVLPNGAGESTGTLFSALGNSHVTLTAKYNTVFLGTGGGCAVGETYAGHAGMLSLFKSNLFWDTSERAPKLFDSGADNSVTDLVAAADADYNGGFNFTAGSNSNGYDHLEFSSGSPGANDVEGDPEFADDTADLDTWDSSLGGAGTYAAALARLKANPYAITDLFDFIKTGFAPTNDIYHNTGYDGGDIGAVPFAGGSPASALSLAGPTSGLVGVQSTNFTVTPNGAFTGSATPTVTGGGVFTPTSLTWNNSSTPQTFKYTPATGGAKTIGVVNDGGLTTPPTITYTASVAPATTFTFTGPSGGVVGAPSTVFTVTPSGPYTGNVTPNAGGGGGSFAPSSLSWTNDNAPKTFSYTPVSEGVKTISITNSGALTNPAPLSYAASLGLATSLAITGPSQGEVDQPSSVFTVTPNANYTGTVTPVAVGGGTFSPSVLTWASSSAPQTFIYTPDSEGGKTVSLSNSGGISNPAPLTYTALPRNAAGFTFSGPSTGFLNEATSDFTVVPNGNFTGTITPSAGTGGGTFTPATLYWSNSEVAKMFTYTPVTVGQKTIALTNDAGVDNPPSIVTMVSERSLCNDVVVDPSPCNLNYPFSITRTYSAVGGPNPCTPHFPVLKNNFTVPATGVRLQIMVSDTTPFYVGQGIKIGPGYYQVTDILSSTTLEVAHNGVGTTVGLFMIAAHPQYGCYQYPITPAGCVRLENLLTVKGYAQNGTLVTSAFTVTGTAILSYGSIGPKTIAYDVNVVGTIANNPYTLGVDLPKPCKASPIHQPSAEYFDGTNWVTLAAAMVGTTQVGVKKIDGTAFAAGANRTVLISGVYETA